MANKSNEFKTLVHKQWAKVSKRMYDFNVPINLTLPHSTPDTPYNDFTAGLQSLKEN